MKKIHKTRNSIFFVVVVLVSLFLVCIGVINFHAYFGQGNPIELVEIQSSAIDLEHRTITNISEDEFKEYPELGDLFCNVTPIGDENFGNQVTKSVNTIIVSERKTSEIRKEHSPKTFFWKEDIMGYWYNNHNLGMVTLLMAYL